MWILRLETAAEIRHQCKPECLHCLCLRVQLCLSPCVRSHDLATLDWDASFIRTGQILWALTVRSAGTRTDPMTSGITTHSIRHPVIGESSQRELDLRLKLERLNILLSVYIQFYSCWFTLTAPICSLRNLSRGEISTSSAFWIWKKNQKRVSKENNLRYTVLNGIITIQ